MQRCMQPKYTALSFTKNILHVGDIETTPNILNNRHNCKPPHPPWIRHCCRPILSSHSLLVVPYFTEIVVRRPGNNFVYNFEFFVYFGPLLVSSSTGIQNIYGVKFTSAKQNKLCRAKCKELFAMQNFVTIPL